MQPSPARPGLIDRHDLVAALDHAAEKKATIISAPAGSGKTSLLRVWAGRPGQDRRIAFTSARPGRQGCYEAGERSSPDPGDPPHRDNAGRDVIAPAARG